MKTAIELHCEFIGIILAYTSYSTIKCCRWSMLFSDGQLNIPQNEHNLG